jgi:histone H2B
MSETGEPEVNFSIYIYKVLKQVHPGTGITSEAKAQVNSLLNVVAEAISSKAAFICHKDKKKTLSSRMVQAAMRLVLPGELAKHAVLSHNKLEQASGSHQPELNDFYAMRIARGASTTVDLEER